MSGLPWTHRLAFGWHLVGGLTTLVAGASWWLDLPIAIAWAVPFLVLIGRVVTRRPRPSDAWRVHSDWLARSVLGVAALLAFVTAWTTLIPDWDGMAIWGLKAKLLAMGELDAAWLQAPLNLPAHPEYPLHVPLRAALIAQVVGWHGGLLSVLLVLDVVALGLLVLGSVEARRRGPAATWILVGLFAVPALWDEIPRGYADPTIALALAATLVALDRWLRSGDRVALALAALSAGVGAWTKQEGLVLLIVAFGVAWLLAPFADRRRLPVVVAGAVGVSVAVPWQLVRRGLGIATEPFGWRGVEQLDRLPIILGRIAEEMTTLDRWSLLWPASAIALIAWVVQAVRSRRTDAASWLPALALLGALAAWTAIYVATPHDVIWHLDTSLHRLLVQLVPAAMLTILSLVDATHRASTS
ncbi:MAG: hypothetical protein AAGE94_04015, partial [Acidobacteriota bacterium]